MQMLSQLSYRPVPRIIPNRGKPRERTIPGVTTDRTIDPTAGVGRGDALSRRSSWLRQDRLAVVAGVLA